MLAITYLLAGLSIAYILEKRIVTASIFAVFPTIDSGFNYAYPIVENGVIHSIPAAFVSGFLIYIYTEDKESAKSCLIGYLSHITLDLISSKSIMAFYPLSFDLSVDLMPPDNLWWNLCLITVFLSGMFVKKNPEIFEPIVNFR